MRAKQIPWGRPRNFRGDEASSTPKAAMPSQMSPPPDHAHAPQRATGVSTPAVSFTVAAILAVFSGCDPSPLPSPAPRGAPPPAGVDFTPRIIAVTPTVHVAVGYGLANSILIQGQNGSIVVDAMESPGTGARVREAFSSLDHGPIQALVYTHNHPDHIYGASTLAGNDDPRIYAHASTSKLIDRVATVIQPSIFTRSMRQHGALLPAEFHRDSGIGPRLDFRHDTGMGLLRPTHTFDGDSLVFEAAGRRIVLFHSPGETPDQISVWLPDERVLLPGDNFYHAFPNLYAIRGTAHRDAITWVESLDHFRRLRPDHLVPSHTLPISGRTEIHAQLTDYRDAIQFVHDQTVRRMNQGWEPDEIVADLKLPAHLSRRDFLRETYGRIDWSIRGIYHGYMGWFGGNATDLGRLAPTTRARHVAELAGGTDSLLVRAAAAIESDDIQWGLELADLVLKLEPNRTRAKSLRAAALRDLGLAQTNANARNYYLTQSLEADGSLTIGGLDRSQVPSAMLQGISMEAIFRSLPVNLDPRTVADLNLVIGFRFPDTAEAWSLIMRRGVADVERGLPEPPQILVTTDSLVWKEVLTGRRNFLAASISGDLQIEGSVIDLGRVLLAFRPSGS